MTHTYTQQHAAALGLADSYWDVEGGFHTISEDVLVYFIDALQLPEPAGDVDEVRVLNADTPQSLPLTVPVKDYQLYDEQQRLILQCPKKQHRAQDLDLPALSAGYYSLTLQTSDGEALHWRLIAAPAHCYQPDDFTVSQQRGLLLQLYSLRSQRGDDLLDNWGIGDFADLLDAIELAHARGLDFIGINPIHALFPSNPHWFSPYSPSSRVFFHWIYLSIGHIPEFRYDAANQAWFEKQRPTLQRLRQLELVNYVAVSEIKMQALHRAFNAFNQRASHQRRAQFDAFVERGGEALARNAAFYTREELLVQGESLSTWQLAHANAPDVEAFMHQYSDRILFFSYLQWLIEEQLATVQQRCRQRQLRLGLYGDLAVGVAQHSADAWSNPALYQLPATIGAPPDPLGPVGQNWTLPPMHPTVLQQQGYQPVIDLLRANMRHFGALRIDHVMGLYRLWLIPEGKTPADGVYLHYPFDTLMAILAIESQRAQCVIIGEDLGTVPDEVRDTLSRYGVLSYDVLYFAPHDNAAQQRPRWRRPQDVKPEALGVIGTHDLPPLAGWWDCCDLKELGNLGILSEADLKPLYDKRLFDKQALLNALKADGFLPDNYEIDALTMAMHPRLNRAIHAYARAGETRLFGIQPENFCGLTQAFNIPGTTTQAPNWQRKLPCPLADIDMTF